MRRLFSPAKTKGHAAVLVSLIIMASGLLGGADSWGAGDKFNVSLNLYTTMPEDGYLLGVEAIALQMVIKNESKWPINVERGFAQVELNEALIVTDPSGQKHTVRQAEIAANMPPPYFWNGKETTPAEILPANWVRTVKIGDLRDLFPMMRTTPGCYTIEAEQPFVGFDWTIQHDQLGLLGIVDPANNRTIKSQNQLKLCIKPLRGAQFNLRGMDLSSNAPTVQVPVKVFRQSDVPAGYTFGEAWEKVQPVIAGTTDFYGWAIWESGKPCMPEDDYLAVGFYRNEFKAALFESGVDEWNANCGGLLTRRIFFREPTEKYAVYASNSVWIRNKARIMSGVVGAPGQSAGPWLSADAEVAVAENVFHEDGVKVVGDTVQIRSTASVFDVYYRELDNLGGEIRGDECLLTSNDCTYPAWIVPTYPAINPGSINKASHAVPSDEELVLPQGSYGNITLESNSILTLTGGYYHLANLILGSGAMVRCVNPTTILIAGRLYPGTKAYLGPSLETYDPEKFSAANVVIVVAGINGKKGDLKESPKAAEIGEGNTIRASIYVPNGTLLTGEGCELTGCFAGKDVVIGMKTTVVEESGF